MANENQTPVIPHNKPSLGEAEKKAAARVLDSGWVAAGREVAMFEQELADFVGTTPECVLATSSGSAALLLAFLTRKAQVSRVRAPTYGCSAIADAASLAGLRCDFIDSSEWSPSGNWSTVPSGARATPSISVAVDLFGSPGPRPDPDSSLVIADAAQSFGAASDGIPTCLRGDLGIASFSPTKIMTVGGYGGALFSASSDWISEARDFRDWDAREDGNRRFHLTLGDIGAAIGRAQLRRLPELIERRLAIIAKYHQNGIGILEASPADSSSGYRAIAVDRDAHRRISSLRARGVGSIIPYELGEMRGRGIEGSPFASKWAKQLVSLPVFPDMSSDQVDSVISAWHATTEPLA